MNSDAYDQLNSGEQEDGYLEGYMRFVMMSALQRLVEKGAFEKLKRAPALRVGYAYSDTERTNVVAVVRR